MSNRSRVVVAVGLVAGLVLAVAGWSLLTPATAFRRSGSVGSDSSVGEAWNFGMGSAARDVDIRSVAAAIEPGSARVSTAVSICRVRSSRVTQIGAAPGFAALPARCDEVLPVDGARIAGAKSEDASVDYLVLTVVPLEAGQVVIDGLDVTLESRWRARTERTGPQVTLHVKVADAAS